MSTAHYVSAPRALQPEGTPVRLIPSHVLAAPPLATATIVPTLYDPEAFAALYQADKARAIALIAAMTEPQRLCQALAYAAWLGSWFWRSTWRPCWRCGRARDDEDVRARALPPAQPASAWLLEQLYNEPEKQ